MASPPDTPFIHHPDMKDDKPEKNGLVCFLNMDRPCGADCMAWQERPEGKDYVGQWADCMLLVNLHRGAKHLTILASVTDTFLQKSKTQAADQARQGQAPPPAPR